jgi:hypothetical protein
MPKLTTRQILLLGVTLLAVLYGAYDLLFTGRKSPVAANTAKQAVDMGTFISEITVTLAKDTPSPVDARMIKRAETPWPRDPFYEQNSYRQLTAADEPPPAVVAAAVSAEKSKFNYTGYVDTGRKKIAILNGSEYAMGDALAVVGYVVNGIYPDRIVIYHKETRRMLEIPLQE